MRMNSDCCDAPFEVVDGKTICLDCGQECEPAAPKCTCGSNKERYPLEDARGIFCAYVCEDCEEEVKGRYRPEVFEDSHYDMPEAELNPEFFD